MRWSWSEVILRKFREKYEPIFRSIGWKTEVSERVIRHVGGAERMISVSIFKDGYITIRHLAISEVIARDDRWLRISSTYNSAGVVRRKLDEVVWKSFYSQLNRLVEGCIRDLLPKYSVKFSLSGGLELSTGVETITLSLDQLAELPKVAAPSAL